MPAFWKEKGEGKVRHAHYMNGRAVHDIFG